MFHATLLATTRRNLLCSIRYFSITPKVYKETAICKSAEEAILDVKPGSTIALGGFGVCGIPENLIRSLSRSSVKDLTVISCTGGLADCGVGELLENDQVKRLVSSYVGDNNLLFDKFLSGQLEIELVPQGTLAERLRAAGAGIPGFYTATGYGTYVHKGGVPMKYSSDGKSIVMVSEPKEERIINGRGYILEPAIYPDVALVRAHKADTFGNLVFNKTASNYNPIIAKAASKVIVEVDEIVEAGELDPASIHVSGLYVDKIYKGQMFKRRLEKKRLQTPPKSDKDESSKKEISSREKIILRAAKELQDGMYVNLGIGIPVLAANHVPKGTRVFLHGENGIMGLGPYPASDAEVDPDLTNAGKETVTAIRGASYFGSDESFAMIRGGHLDLTMLGALQVSQTGDIANWIVPGQKVNGMGGAMDLVASRAAGTRVIVTMEHNAKNGAPKVLKSCTLPLTGMACVDRIITEKAVFDVVPNSKLLLIEMSKDITLDELRKVTDADFEVSTNLKCMD